MRKLTIDLPDNIYDIIIEKQYKEKVKTKKFVSIHSIVVPVLEKEFVK